MNMQYPRFAKSLCPLSIIGTVFLVAAIILADNANAEIQNPDPTFGGIGYVTLHNTAGGGGRDAGNAVAVQEDGKIVVAGYSWGISDDDMVVWRFNTDGTLDESFNGVGYFTHNNAAGGNNQDRGNSVVIQSDGKIVVAGYSRGASTNNDMTVWRLSANGTLDTTFNGIGFMSHNGATGVNDNDIGNAVQLQPDGKIVVTGLSQSIVDWNDMTIWRLKTDGTLDETFGDGSCHNGVGDGTKGCVHHNGAASGAHWDDEGKSLVIDGVGNIVVSGYSAVAVSPYNTHMVVWKYTSSGILDTTFGVNACTGGTSSGCVSHADAAGAADNDVGLGIVSLDNGSYVVDGYSKNTNLDNDLVLWKYDNAGQLDEAFGIHNCNNGVGAGNDMGCAVYDMAGGSAPHEVGYSIASDAFGNYVTSGNARNSDNNYDLSLCRISSDGSLDLTFNGTGCFLHDSAAGGGGDDAGSAIIIDSSGQIIVAGKSMNETDEDMAVWKYGRYFQVDNLPASLNVEDEYGNNIETGTLNGVYGENTVYLKDDENYLIADARVDFTKYDLDWSEISGAVDTTAKKAVVDGLIQTEGVVSHGLYVPKAQDDVAVGYCPFAAILEDVEEDCTGLQVMDEGDEGIYVITVTGQEYWRIEGPLLGSGGYSISDTEENDLVDTGEQACTVLVGGGMVLLLLCVLSCRFLIGRNDRKEE